MRRRLWLPIFSFDIKILQPLSKILIELLKNHKQTLRHYLLQLKILPNSFSEWMSIILMHMKRNTPFQTSLLWDISRRQFILELKSLPKWNINTFTPNAAGLLRPPILTSMYLRPHKLCLVTVACLTLYDRNPISLYHITCLFQPFCWIL